MSNRGKAIMFIFYGLDLKNQYDGRFIPSGCVWLVPGYSYEEIYGE